MEFLLIGRIKSIKSTKFGCCVSVRETKIGSITKNGHNTGTYDCTWNCMTSSSALTKYINNFFKENYLVIIKGIEISFLNVDEEKVYHKNIYHKIETINLWNMGDPSIIKNRERYNSKVIGDETPDINNKFDNDFN